MLTSLGDVFVYRDVLGHGGDGAVQAGGSHGILFYFGEGNVLDANAKEKPAGPANYYNIVQKRAKMEGFVILDYLPRAAEAVTDLAGWVADGHITWEADIQHGFENAPKTLLRLYQGANFGKQLLEI